MATLLAMWAVSAKVRNANDGTQGKGKMNYYSDREIEQAIEEPDRLPRPASSHVSLTTRRAAGRRKDRSTLQAGAFGLAVFAFVLIANTVQLPSIVLALFAGTVIGVFAFLTIKGEK